MCIPGESSEASKLAMSCSMRLRVRRKQSRHMAVAQAEAQKFDLPIYTYGNRISGIVPIRFQNRILCIFSESPTENGLTISRSHMALKSSSALAACLKLPKEKPTPYGNQSLSEIPARGIPRICAFRSNRRPSSEAEGMIGSPAARSASRPRAANAAWLRQP